MSELAKTINDGSTQTISASIKNELDRLAHLVLDLYKWESIMAKKLMSSPLGFEFVGDGRQCAVCLGSDNKMWYDQAGIKCLDCEKAFAKKIIPKYTLKASSMNAYVTDSFLISNMGYSEKDLEVKLSEGKLRARKIEHRYRKNTLLFLKRENKELFSSVLA